MKLNYDQTNHGISNTFLLPLFQDPAVDCFFTSLFVLGKEYLDKKTTGKDVNCTGCEKMYPHSSRNFSHTFYFLSYPNERWVDTGKMFFMGSRDI